MAFGGSGSYALLAIALLVAFGTLYPTVSNTGERIAGAQEEVREQRNHLADTAIAVASATYDGSTLSLRVNNTGERTLSVARTDVLVDGAYFGEGSFESSAVDGTSGTDLWQPGQTLEVTIAVDDPVRVKVVTELGVSATAFVRPFARNASVAFTLGDSVRSATNATLETGYGETAEAAGPVVENFSNLGTVEAAAVDAGSDLFVVTTAGDRTTLATGAKGGTSRLTAGYWQGNAASVFYVDAASDDIRRVTADGTTTAVAAVTADGLGGIADVDGDDADELVFGGDGGNSDEVSYVDDDSTVVRTGQSYGTDSGNVGLGEPADFDGDGTARVPIVDGNNDVQLTDGGGATTTILGSGTAVKAPIGTADVDADGDPEVVFVSTDTNADGDNAVRYVDDVTGTNTVRNLTAGTGSTLGADTDAGVV